MSLNEVNDNNKSTRIASSSELNSWKRGFTPQAEIWNGRMAIAGLVILITILLFSNLIFSG
ncbi:high light inducible protein [Prochlorococcus marinus]|uniref:high light inducible protein n=1 Tax=Prochlorococcus marinus TaxID=1219 RepID=UPI0022B38C42|nr:high light inducible protein [Prochlorococcus marinus]